MTSDVVTRPSSPRPTPPPDLSSPGTRGAPSSPTTRARRYPRAVRPVRGPVRVLPWAPGDRVRRRAGRGPRVVSTRDRAQGHGARECLVFDARTGNRGRRAAGAGTGGGWGGLRALHADDRRWCASGATSPRCSTRGRGRRRARFGWDGASRRVSRRRRGARFAAAGRGRDARVRGGRGAETLGGGVAVGVVERVVVLPRRGAARRRRGTLVGRDKFGTRAHFGLRRTRMTESPRRNILLMKRSLLTGAAFFAPLPVGTSVQISFTFSSTMLQWRSNAFPTQKFFGCSCS